MTFNYSDNIFNNRTFLPYHNQIQQADVTVQNTTKGAKILGNITGAGIGLALPVYDLADNFKLHEISNESTFMKKFLPDIETFENTQKNINELIAKNGMKEKGVEFVAYDGSFASANEIKNILSQEYKGSNKLVRRLKDNMLNDIINGENAFYGTKSKKIVVNKNTMFSSAYHEYGHSLNSHSTFGKILEKGKLLTPLGIPILAPVVLAIGLLHKTDNNKPKEEKSFKERSLDFIKNNAGKIVLASNIPLLTDEALASIKGLKAAKSILTNTELSKLKLNYTKAWGTYAVVALLSSIGVSLGIKAADHIKNRKNKEN